MERSRIVAGPGFQHVVAFIAIVGILPAQEESADRLREMRQELEREHATRLVEIGKQLIDADLIIAARTAKAGADLLDPNIAGQLRFPPPPETPKRRDGNWGYIVQIVDAILDGAPISSETLAAMAKFHPLLPDLARARAQAAEDLQKVVAGYRESGDVETAFELARVLHELYRPAIREDYRELGDELAARSCWSPPGSTRTTTAGSNTTGPRKPKCA